MTRWRIIQGDALTELQKLEDESVHCCVTSPPYWGLRDYGTARWEGGDPTCDHKQGRNGAGRADGVVDERGQRNRDGVGAMGGDCKKCGARRIDDQLGLERTPQEYVGKMVDVFTEVRRALRRDGTLWLNIGDSYAGSGAVAGGDWKQSNTGSGGTWAGGPESTQRRHYPPSGLKPKDLVGIPWLLAFALRDAGWWLRSDIIWHKPNPMPESVRDRCTKAHEYVFMLAKSERYYFDADAVAEDALCAGQITTHRSPKEITDPGYDGHRTRKGMHGRDILIASTRNRRSVWTITSEPYADAHFAVMPTALAELCIKAGCPVGGTVLDPFCGAGTTGLVANRLGRDFIGIELNPTYCELAHKRIHDDAPLIHAIAEKQDEPQRQLSLLEVTPCGC